MTPFRRHLILQRWPRCDEAAAKIYGLMAEFATPEQLLEAAHHTHDAGYTRIDAFSPFPIEGLADAVGFHGTRLPLVVLLAGIMGGVAGFFLQYYAAAVSYPINVGGTAAEQLAGVHSDHV